MDAAKKMELEKAWGWG